MQKDNPYENNKQNRKEKISGGQQNNTRNNQGQGGDSNNTRGNQGSESNTSRDNQNKTDSPILKIMMGKGGTKWQTQE